MGWKNPWHHGGCGNLQLWIWMTSWKTQQTMEHTYGWMLDVAREIKEIIMLGMSNIYIYMYLEMLYAHV